MLERTVPTAEGTQIAWNEAYDAQLLDYLMATPYEVGLPLNFGP